MDKPCRELGMFQQDIKALETEQIKRIKNLAFLVAQLKRFNRSELMLFTEFCDAVVEERKGQLSEIHIETNPEMIDNSLDAISEKLMEQFKKRQAPNWTKL